MLVGGEWVEVNLSNVSVTGLMVKFPGGLPVGTPVELRRRGIAITGKVVWSSSTRIGIRSFGEIDQSSLLDAGLQPKPSANSAPLRKAWWHWRG